MKADAAAYTGVIVWLVLFRFLNPGVKEDQP
jgi:hypothetical protein